MYNAVLDGNDIFNMLEESANMYEESQQHRKFHINECK